MIESLFHSKTYTGPDGSIRHQFFVDKRIYPSEPFDAPVFTFVNCKPDSKSSYVLKISLGPRMKISRVSSAAGGLRKMQINAELDREQAMPPITLYLAKTGLPLTREQIADLKQHKWGYECRLLSQPDKIIAYFYTA